MRKITLLESAQLNRYDLRSGGLPTATQSRTTEVLNAIKNPHCIPFAFRTALLLGAGIQGGNMPKGPVFLTSKQAKEAFKNIESYPEKYGADFLDVYFQHHVERHVDPADKWNLVEVVESVFQGRVIYKGAISIGEIRIDGNTYLILGHDKTENGGRAGVKDHQASIDALKNIDNDSKIDGIIYWVDTPGADSGAQANKDHQAAVMSELISTVSGLSKPSMTILAGEGGSGGAEVFFGTDLRIALKGSYFSTIHPIGHAGILRGKYSPKEIAYLLGVSAPELLEKNVVDALSVIDPISTTGIIELAKLLPSLIRDGFTHIEEGTIDFSNIFRTSADESRLLLRGIRSRAKTAGMLSSREDVIEERIKKLSKSIRYEDKIIFSDFIATIRSGIEAGGEVVDLGDLKKSLMSFFSRQLGSSNLTKFNILRGIDTLLEKLGTTDLSSVFPKNEVNNIIGFLKEQLYHYQFFFGTLSIIIDPKNYDKFFTVGGMKHHDSLIEGSDQGLYYTHESIESFLRNIFDSANPKHIHTDFSGWKKVRFEWLNSLLSEDIDLLLKIGKDFKTAHYDLPDTIIPLAYLLLQKFSDSVLLSPDQYVANLLSTDVLAVDFEAKRKYELIRLFEQIRKTIFGKLTSSDFESQFFQSFQPMEDHFQRSYITPLQKAQDIQNKPRSAVTAGFGRIKGISEIQFATVIVNFGTEGGAIDGSAAANIIKLLDHAAKEGMPVIFFLQSAGMYVDGGPEAVSSMTTLNTVIREYQRKVKGNPRAKIFSIPYGVCTGGTIASFAQAPGVTVLPISLSEILFAGRIVTLDLLPLETTLADSQIGKGVIQGIIDNPFIDEARKAEIYDLLRKYGIDIDIPSYSLADMIRLHMGQGMVPFQNQKNGVQKEDLRSNIELFHSYKKVAILNRGVIAAKSIKVLKKLKIDYRLFYTAQDSILPYVQQEKDGNKGVRIDDYMMNPLAIIQTIKDAGCDAVYLGYGFYSERDDFIKLCEKNGIIVIGPTSENVKRMGDKISARVTFKSVLKEMDMTDSGYSPARGSDDILGGEGIVEDVVIAKDVAGKIGYPVMLKAVYGGGGKGIAKIRTPEEFDEKFIAMQNEAENSFGNKAMYLEKALENQRHVEVQIFRDIDGNCVALGVRDCTTQRNRQKCIEETGDSDITTDRLRKLMELCKKVANNIDYVGAGTFEFLYSPDTQDFTFMEMNTRIQVEHTITERLVRDAYGRKAPNLVELQFLLASGKTHKILDSQERIEERVLSYKGHTMEARICSEDPASNFLGKSMAEITHWSLDLPVHLKKKVYFETALRKDLSGKNHTSKYDSMFGQLIVSGKNREDSINIMLEALQYLKIEGIPTNIEFLTRILKSNKFQERELRIDSMDSKPEEYFGGLTPFTGKVTYVSQVKEDTVVLEPGQFVVRTDREIKISSLPEVGTIISDSEDTTIFEANIAKTNTKILFGELQGEGFYMKDSSGELLPIPSNTKFRIVRVLMNQSLVLGRGKAVFVITPV